MKIFNNIASLSLAVLVENQLVRTKGAQSMDDGYGVTYIIKATGPDVKGITLANGNIAVPLPSDDVLTPMAFGATGDGVTNDTAAVQNCLDTARSTLIDRAYAVNVGLVSSQDIVTTGDGIINYIGGNVDPITDIITVNNNITSLAIDAGLSEVRAVVLSDDVNAIISANQIAVKNIVQQQSGPQGQAVAVFNPACEFHCDTMIFNNLTYETPEGYAGGGTQGCVTSFTGRTTVTKIYANQCLSIVLADQSGSVNFGTLHSYKCFAQPIYNLDGTVKGGTVYADECLEEVIVNQGWLAIDEVVATGPCFSVLRLRASEYTYIGNIHGGYSRAFSNQNRAIGDAPDFTPLELTEQLPRGIVEHRTGNSTFINGPVYIGNVTGKFAESLFRTGFGTGQTEYLHIGNMNVDLYFDDATHNIGNWFNLVGVNQCDIDVMHIRIVDVNDTGGTTFLDSWYDELNPKTEPSYVYRMDVELVTSTFGPSDNQFQGQRPSKQLRFEPSQAVWSFNFGSPRVSINVGARGSTVTDSAPNKGYFLLGDYFNNGRAEYKVNDVAGWTNRVEGDETAFNFQEVRLAVPQLADSLPPAAALVPDARGQMFIDSSTTPRTVWYGFALTAGSWIKLNNEP